MIITKIKDPRVELARDLRTRAGRKTHNKFLLESDKLLKSALDNNVSFDFVLYGNNADLDLIRALESKGVECLLTSDSILKKITDTSYLVSIIAVVNCKKKTKLSDFIVVMDDLQDLGNIGTIVRTASAFGVKDLMLISEYNDIYSRKTLEASVGTVFGVNCSDFKNSDEAIRALKAEDYCIVATTPYGDNLQSMAKLPDRPIALIVGNETNGVSSSWLDVADLKVQMTMSTDVESLNVGVAAGISIYELKFKKVLSMLLEKIKSLLGREISITQALLRKKLDEELKKVSSLSALDVIFLMILSCDKKMGMEQVSQDTNLRGKDLESFIDRLSNENLLKIEKDYVFVLSKTEETLAKLWPIVEKCEVLALKDFSMEEVFGLFKYLTRIQNNLDPQS